MSMHPQDIPEIPSDTSEVAKRLFPKYLECHSQHFRKNSHHDGKQNYICVSCSRQFTDHYETNRYSDDVKRLCVRLYVNGIGFRDISRVTGIPYGATIT